MVTTLLFGRVFGVLAFARDTAVGEWLHQLFVVKPASWLSQSPTRIAAHILTVLVFAGLLISGFELLFLTVDLFFVIGFLDFAMFAELAILLTLSGPIARVRVAISIALKTAASTLSKVRPERSVRQRRLQKRRRLTANDDGDDQPAWPLAWAA